MNKSKFRGLAASLSICAFASALTFIAAAAMPSVASAANDDNGKWNVNISIDIDWKAVGKWLGREIGDHPTTQYVIEVDGLKAVLVPVQNGGTERITNETRLSDGLRNDEMRVLFANTNTTDPKSLKAQEKHDEKFGGDTDESEVFTHNQIVKIKRGAKNYFAGRSAGWAKGMIIVFSDPKMTPDQLKNVSRVVVRP